MQFIIEFLEYKLTGIGYGIYLVVMIIFSLACLGVVGDKVAKKKQAELLAKREALAKEESEKAKEMVKKQAESYGVSNTLDPTAKKAQQAQANPAPATDVTGVVQQGVPEVAPPVVEPTQEPVPEVVVLEAPATPEGTVVDNVTPIVDNTSEDAVKTDEEVPSVLVINDDGTSNVSN